METAFRMQSAATDAFDINREPNRRSRRSTATLISPTVACWPGGLAERGVRLVQVYYGDGQPWDTHRNHNETTRKLARDIDQPDGRPARPT